MRQISGTGDRDDRLRLAEAKAAALESENAELREKVALLETAKIGRAGFLSPDEWGLTTSEEALFACLWANREATKDALHLALYWDSGADGGAGLKIIDVYVCKIRKKVQPFGIKIKTIWGRGYALPESTRKLIRDNWGDSVPDSPPMTARAPG